MLIFISCHFLGLQRASSHEALWAGRSLTDRGSWPPDAGCTSARHISQRRRSSACKLSLVPLEATTPGRFMACLKMWLNEPNPSMALSFSLHPMDLLDLKRGMQLNTRLNIANLAGQRRGLGRVRQGSWWWVIRCPDSWSLANTNSLIHLNQELLSGVCFLSVVVRCTGSLWKSTERRYFSTFRNRGPTAVACYSEPSEIVRITPDNKQSWH
jgi:hypothetical protein